MVHSLTMISTPVRHGLQKATRFLGMQISMQRWVVIVPLMVCIIIGRMQLLHFFRHLPVYFLSTRLPVSRLHRYLGHRQINRIWTSLRKDPPLGGSSGVSRYHLRRATPMPLPNGSTPTLFQWTARGGLGTGGNTSCTGQLEASQSFHELI